jgi:protein involved in polysaccharide export with SLBB domain
MSRLAGLLCLAVVFALLSGCATSRDKAYSKILKELEAELAEDEKAAQTKETDRPDAPIGYLPSVLGDSALPGGGGPLTIQRDCLLHISVEEDPGLDGSYPVGEIGDVKLGYIGPVILLNKTETEAARKIETTLKRRDFRNATVRVRIQRASYDKIRVVGAVAQRGLIQIGAGDVISLNDALLRADGLIPSIRGPQVRVVRGGLTNALWRSFEGEVYALVADDGTPTVPPVSLRNNDIVAVFSTEANAPIALGEKEVLVLGEVNKPGLYRFTGEQPCTMMHLLFRLGGLPMYAKRSAVRIVRANDTNGEEDEEIIVDVDEILDDGNPDDDIALENGDRIIVPARRLSFF